MFREQTEQIHRAFTDTVELIYQTHPTREELEDELQQLKSELEDLEERIEKLEKFR